jgi:hypothetical protein
MPLMSSSVLTQPCSKEGTGANGVFKSMSGDSLYKKECKNYIYVVKTCNFSVIFRNLQTFCAPNMVLFLRK